MGAALVWRSSIDCLRVVGAAFDLVRANIRTVFAALAATTTAVTITAWAVFALIRCFASQLRSAVTALVIFRGATLIGRGGQLGGGGTTVCAIVRTTSTATAISTATVTLGRTAAIA